MWKRRTRWERLRPATHEWLLDQEREPISWHILGELHRARVKVLQPDPNRSVFRLTDETWDLFLNSDAAAAAARPHRAEQH